MQRGEAGASIIGIGARLHQLDRQLEVSVAYRHQQRTQAAVYGLGAGIVGRALGPLPHPLEDAIQIRADREQRQCDIDVTLAHGEEQRREPRSQGGVDAGPGVYQGADPRRVSLGCRPHQRSLFAPLLGVGIGAGGKQAPHRGQGSGARSDHEDGFPSLEQLPVIGTGIEQQLHQGPAAIGGGQGQRRHAVTVVGVDIGSGAHQYGRQIDIVVVCRPVERGHSVDLRGVDLRTFIEQTAYQRLVLILNRVCQRRDLGPGGRGRGHTDHSNQAQDQKQALTALWLIHVSSPCSYSTATAEIRAIKGAPNRRARRCCRCYLRMNPGARQPGPAESGADSPGACPGHT